VGNKGAGQSGLEFQIRDGDAWRAISGNTQAETQRKILDTIKLSYDTFVNSSFLVQGRADAFTLKSPGERKEVLAEILDLGRYCSIARFTMPMSSWCVSRHIGRSATAFATSWPTW
jgi:exonuclease SbcC